MQISSPAKCPWCSSENGEIEMDTHTGEEKIYCRACDSYMRITHDVECPTCHYEKAQMAIEPVTRKDTGAMFCGECAEKERMAKYPTLYRTDVQLEDSADL